MQCSPCNQGHQHPRRHRGGNIIQLLAYRTKVGAQAQTVSFFVLHPHTRLALRSLSLQPDAQLTMMPDDLNIDFPHLISRAAEGFHDRGITDAAGGPKTQAVENHIHTVRVAGINNRGVAVSCASTEFGNQGQLQRQGDAESATGYELGPDVLPLSILPR